jgi:tRNA pseudouridine55 synthase
MNGFLLVDKPRGITSFYCVRILRKLAGLKRIGFVGTLDPLATGLMIFAFGEATKLINLLENSDKAYETVVRLGAVSDTYDAEGKITENAVAQNEGAQKPTKEEIAKVIGENFSGAREQMPPAFSAIQIGGKRAYDLARKGQKVELKKRLVHFYSIEVVSYSWPLLRLLVHCGSGTYIRSLAHDLGERLGCGGYVEVLRRVSIGKHKVDEAVKLDDLDAESLKKAVIAPQDFLTELSVMELDDEEYGILGNGGFVEGRGAGGHNAGDAKAGAILAVYKGQCAGVLEKFNGKLKFRKKFNMIAEPC